MLLAQLCRGFPVKLHCVFPRTHQGEHHQAQGDEAAALGQPLLLEPFDGLQQLGQLHPADAVVMGDAGSGDDLAGFDGGVVLSKFQVNITT